MSFSICPKMNACPKIDQGLPTNQRCGPARALVVGYPCQPTGLHRWSAGGLPRRTHSADAAARRGAARASAGLTVVCLHCKGLLRRPNGNPVRRHSHELAAWQASRSKTAAHQLTYLFIPFRSQPSLLLLCAAMRHVSLCSAVDHRSLVCAWIAGRRVSVPYLLWNDRNLVARPSSSATCRLSVRSCSCASTVPCWCIRTKGGSEGTQLCCVGHVPGCM